MWIIEDTLKQRFAILPEMQQAEDQFKLSGMTDCPARYREADDAHFVLVKTGESRHRDQFF